MQSLIRKTLLLKSSITRKNVVTYKASLHGDDDDILLQATFTVAGAWRSSWHPYQHARSRVSGTPTILHYPFEEPLALALCIIVSISNCEM